MSNESVNEKNSTDVNESLLRPVSLRLLYEGMIVRDDIYDSSGDRLLMKAENTLTADLIERMLRINGGNDIIYVTARTHKTMMSKRPNIPIDRRLDIEDTTGYTDSLVKLTNLFIEIIMQEKVDSTEFLNLAGVLSKRVTSDAPGLTLSVLNAVAPVSEFLPRHIINVAMLNGLTGMWLGMTDEQIFDLVLCGLLHDCGQALMPQKMLSAPRRFSLLEHEVVKTHPIRAVEMLDGFNDDVRAVAATHHERLDGSGYPKGISGSDIVMSSRITTVSDIYDGVVSSRPHRPTRSPFHALALFDELAPKKIDPQVVSAYKENLPKELIDKPVTMSDDTIGIVRGYDPADIKYPMVEISKRTVKTSDKLYCTAMYNDED